MNNDTLSAGLDVLEVLLDTIIKKKNEVVKELAGAKVNLECEQMKVKLLTKQRDEGLRIISQLRNELNNSKWARAELANEITDLREQQDVHVDTLIANGRKIRNLEQANADLTNEKFS